MNISEDFWWSVDLTLHFNLLLFQKKYETLTLTFTDVNNIDRFNKYKYLRHINYA